MKLVSIRYEGRILAAQGKIDFVFPEDKNGYEVYRKILEDLKTLGFRVFEDK